MKCASAVGLLLLTPLLCAPNRAFACSCATVHHPGTPLLPDGTSVPSPEELARQQFLLVGTALSRTWIPDGDPEGSGALRGGTATVFRVEQSWQGEVLFDRLTVFSGYPVAGCGFLFEPGRCYVVFASVGPDGRLTTSICTRTALWERSADLLVHIRANLGPPKEDFLTTHDLPARTQPAESGTHPSASRTPTDARPRP
jgi:hypothetical protein